MQNQNEIAKINHFLRLTSPIVVGQVKILLQSAGLKLKEENHGLNLAFSIKSDEKEVKFFLYNLLLEIATVDRDEEPLRFDGNLRDFDFFLAKTARIIESRLEILFKLLVEDNADTALENICKDAKQYERIRIWKVDQKEST